MTLLNQPKAVSIATAVVLSAGLLTGCRPSDEVAIERDVEAQSEKAGISVVFHDQYGLRTLQSIQTTRSATYNLTFGYSTADGTSWQREDYSFAASQRASAQAPCALSNISFTSFPASQCTKLRVEWTEPGKGSRHEILPIEDAQVTFAPLAMPKRP